MLIKNGGSQLHIMWVKTFLYETKIPQNFLSIFPVFRDNVRNFEANPNINKSMVEKDVNSCKTYDQFDSKLIELFGLDMPLTETDFVIFKHLSNLSSDQASMDSINYLTE
jgi:hypothetical protein